MTDRAYLHGIKEDGTYRWCAYPCQKMDANGNKIDRVCRVSVNPAFNGNVWSVTGAPDAPTLSPSIDCQDKPCWHGFIVNGEVR